MFDLILNENVENLKEIFESFAKDVIFLQYKKTARSNILKWFVDANALQRMKKMEQHFKNSTKEDEVRFFDYVFAIYTLRMIVKDKDSLKENEVKQAENMLLDYRKKIIVIMSKIFVAKQEKKNEKENEGKERLVWIEFLKGGANKLLKSAELFDEEGKIQLDFISNHEDPEIKVKFHLFCVENKGICDLDVLFKLYFIENGGAEVKLDLLNKLLSALASEKRNLQFTEAEKLIKYICSLKTKSKNIFNLLIDVMLDFKDEISMQALVANLVTKHNFIVQLAVFYELHGKDGSDKGKVAKIIEVLQSDQCIGVLKSKEFKELQPTFVSIQKVQSIFIMDEHFKVWQNFKSLLFDKLHQEYLQKDKYEDICSLMNCMPIQKNDRRYAGLAKLWDSFCKNESQQPVIKFQLIKEYMKQGGYFIQEIIGSIYKIDSLKEESKSFLCLIELLAKLLPDKFEDDFACQLDKFSKEQNQSLIQGLLKRLNSKKEILNDILFRHCVFSIALIFYPKNFSIFNEYFVGKSYVSDQKNVSHTYVFANILVNDKDLLNKLKGEGRKEWGKSFIDSKSSEEKIDGIVKNCGSSGEDVPWLDWLIKATPAKDFKHIVYTLLKNQLINKYKHLYEKLRSLKLLKEDQKIAAYELQIELLNLTNRFDDLLEILRKNANLSAQDFYEKHKVFQVLYDFCLIFYGKCISNNESLSILSSEIAKFDNDASFYYDRLIYDNAPIEFIRLILEAYKIKVQAFSEKLKSIASEHLDKRKDAFLAIREYLDSKLKRCEIKQEMSWILPQLIAVLANDVYSQNTKATDVEWTHGIDFICKYYAVQDRFLGLNVKEISKVERLRSLMLVILGSDNPEIFCDHLLKSVRSKNNEIASLCEFSLFFVLDEKFFNAWKEICKMREKSQCDYSKSATYRFFKKNDLQRIVEKLHYLFSSFKGKDSEDEARKQAGFFVYILNKCVDQFRFKDWMAIGTIDKKKSKLLSDVGEKHHVVFFRIGKGVKCVSNRGKNDEEMFIRQFKKLSKSHEIRKDYVQENIEFISEFSKAFFKPHYDCLRKIDIYNPRILFMNYIQRCFKSLKGKYQIKKKSRNRFAFSDFFNFNPSKKPEDLKDSKDFIFDI